MRPYATVSPRFWTGSTGKNLRKNPDAQRVALYLMTSPHSHQTGIYQLPMLYLCTEVGLTEKGASKALLLLAQEGFARYDEQTEWVWVCEMASWQIGTMLSDGDKRCKGVQQYFASLPRLPFSDDFYARYVSDFHLTPPPGAPCQISPLQGAMEGASSEQNKNKNRTEQDHGGLNGHASALPTDISLVFDHWRQEHNRQKSQLDAKRQKLIRVALAAYSPEQLCTSITGYKFSEFHNGKNENKTKYTDIELFLRDAKHIDAGIEFAGKKSGIYDNAL